MRLMLSLFSLGLAAIATFILVKSILPHFGAWQNTRDWVQVDARLTQHDFSVTKSETRNTDGGISIERDHSLTVRYSFSYQGKEYLGSRLAISGVGPSDQFLFKLKQMFDAAERSSKVISVWMNPNNPQQSVVDKSFRWRGLDFVIAFFIGTSVLGYSSVIEMLRNAFFFINPRLHRRLRKKALLQKTKTTTLYDRDSSVAPVGWGLVLLLSLPLYANAIPLFWLIFADGQIVVGLIPLLVGAAFLGICFRLWKMVRAEMIRLGPVNLVVDNYPWQVGGALSGFAKIATKKLPIGASVNFRVGCDRHDHRKAQIKTKKLWTDKAEAKITANGRHSHAQFDFDIPDDLPGAENDRAVKVNWWIELSVDGYNKKAVSKRYDDLGVFQIDADKQLRDEQRLKNNIITTPSALDFSSVFLTNCALLVGIFAFNWSIAEALLGVLVETAMIALLSPLLLIGLPRRTNSAKQLDSKNENVSFGAGLGAAIGTTPFVIGLLAFQLMVLHFFFELPLTDLLVNNDGVFSALLNFIVTYNLWLPIVAVLISVIFEWRKLSRKAATLNVDKLASNLLGGPLIRMFCTTFIMVLSIFPIFMLGRSDSLQGLLLIVVAFKVWVEYSMVRWGRLEV